jgi:iron complex transport system permease protein
MAAGLAATAAAALAAAAWGLAVGAVDLDLFSYGPLGETQALILTHVRLPRVFLAALSGAALATAGAALQPTLRNPLASPDIIGVSGGAALGAVAALALAPPTWLLAVPAAALGGAALSSLLVYRLSLIGGRVEPYTQVLVGVIFNTFAASLILLVHALADLSRSHSIAFWLMGSVAIHSYPVLMVAAALVIAGLLFLLVESGRLNLLALGDRSAEHLGVDLAASRRRVFFASSLLVGAVVSLTGVITFVGLIVPHLLRRLLGSDNRLLVPASAFGGAAFLVAADALARSLAAPAELPVGAVTAMAGGPFFIYLLRRGRRQWSGL